MTYIVYHLQSKYGETENDFSLNTSQIANSINCEVILQDFLNFTKEIFLIFDLFYRQTT